MTGYTFLPTYTDKKTGEKRESRIWWIGYSVGGRRVKESAKTTKRREAETLLIRRLAERVPGAPVPVSLERVTFEDLCGLIRADYEQNGRRSTRRLETSLRHLTAFFGGWRVPAIEENAVERYVGERLKTGAAAGTVNRELSALKRALRLGYRQRLVGRTPDISRLAENNVRKGFFEFKDLWGILECADPCLRPVIETAYVTGWRKEEILSREWKHVDFDAGFLRLDPGETKSGEGRMFPLTNHLRRVLEEQDVRRGRMHRAIANVFFRYDGPRRGQPIRSMDKAWRAARDAAGLKGTVFHDFRRTAVRNLVRAGVPDSIAMKLSGHRTRSVFDRYAISDEASLKAAGEALDAAALQVGYK